MQVCLNVSLVLAVYFPSVMRAQLKSAAGLEALLLIMIPVNAKTASSLPVCEYHVPSTGTNWK